jgi:FtsH ternary system domain X3
MRVRVRFRYRAETGEVETFLVEDVGGDGRAIDHDAVHDRVTADLARLVERSALIEEVLPGTDVDRPRAAEPSEAEPARREGTLEGGTSG